MRLANGFEGGIFAVPATTTLTPSLPAPPPTSDFEPSVYEHLCRHDAQDVVFVYRWLLLNMKREFSFQDGLCLLYTSPSPRD